MLLPAETRLEGLNGNLFGANSVKFGGTTAGQRGVGASLPGVALKQQKVPVSAAGG